MKFNIGEVRTTAVWRPKGLTRTQAINVASKLIQEGCWVAVEPWPDNKWNVFVKPENEAKLTRLIELS